MSLVPAPRLPEHLLANARLLPDRDAILPLLPKGRVIAEIGVALGDFSERFLRICEPAHFIALDLFDLHTIPALWGSPTSELFGGGTHGAFYRQRFAEQIAQGEVTVLEGDSAATLETLEDASLDIVYIDADHTYEPVKRELALVRRKIREDGWIIMNDYIMNDAGFSNAAYGVIQATNEFMIAENWEMIYFAFQSQMFCDVVLRKASTAPVPEPVPVSQVRGTVRRDFTMETRNAALEDALAAMRASTSWRITAPLRALRRSFSAQTRSIRQE